MHEPARLRELLARHCGEGGALLAAARALEAGHVEEDLLRGGLRRGLPEVVLLRALCIRGRQTRVEMCV
eukprot:10136228-Alexandrium_andersonii.AAC.1